MLSSLYFHSLKRQHFKLINSLTCMKKMSKSEAQEKIKSFFEKESFSSEEMKKIRRLAMKHKIRLKDHKKMFCNHCLSPLKGKIRVTATHKTIVCEFCKKPNRFKIN